MQLARIIGHATSTVKHPSFAGWRLLVAQILNPQRAPEGDVVCAVDRIGAGAGELVLINSDGMGAREYIGDPKSPVRWFVIGIVDE